MFINLFTNFFVYKKFINIFKLKPKKSRFRLILTKKVAYFLFANSFAKHTAKGCCKGSFELS